MGEVLAQADRAFVDEDYETAVQLYTQALDQSPSSAPVYEARANAHLKLENYIEAVEDASKAIELDPSGWKAHLRKGIASFKLEEYEAALEAFEAGSKVAPAKDTAQFKTWIRKCQAEIEEEMGQATGSPASATPSGAATSEAKNSPTSVLPQPAQLSPPAAPKPIPPIPAGPASAAPQAVPGPLAKAAPAAFEGKYRHQYYQMQNKVTVDVFAKGVAKEQVSVSFQPKHLTITITDPANPDDEYKLDLDLYGEVLPDQCRYEVLKTKVEVVLVKADSAVQWASLEKSDKVVPANYSNPTVPPVGGQYPTSSKARKDWNKLESEVKELEEKGDMADGDPLNNFFKKIFSQGDENQRRAMMKSFVESNGTVLSTNWDEVGGKKVECTPPDGMVVRKWNE